LMIIFTWQTGGVHVRDSLRKRMMLDAGKCPMIASYDKMRRLFVL